MTDTTPTDWANRIVAYEPAVDPEQLLAHPENARRHPADQREALRESLGNVGWVDVVKVNRVTGHVVDGHARVEEAISKGVSVPVLYVELDESEERFVLATLDPIGAMAIYEAELLTDLLNGVTIENLALLDMLNDQAALGHTFDPWNPGGSGEGGEDGADPDPGAFWPTLSLRLPPGLLDQWNDRLMQSGETPEAFLAQLLGA